VTNQLIPVTVGDVHIVNGVPVITPCTFLFDPKNYVKPKSGIELYPSDELQEDSARLNRMFASGNF